MSKAEQNLGNHVRIDPVFHYVLLSIFTINLILSAVHFFRMSSWFSGWLLVLSLGLLLLLFRTRIYPLKAQDRVIRIEERLRLALLLPESLRPRISEFKKDQLVALRFASDDELPALAAPVLEQRLTPKEIKKRIVKWRPDYFHV